MNWGISIQPNHKYTSIVETTTTICEVVIKNRSGELLELILDKVDKPIEVVYSSKGIETTKVDVNIRFSKEDDISFFSIGGSMLGGSMLGGSIYLKGITQIMDSQEVDDTDGPSTSKRHKLSDGGTHVFSDEVDYNHPFQIQKIPIYLCEFCASRFSQLSNVETHIRTHTGERPFQCIHCEQGFIQKAHAEKHMKSCIRKDEINRKKSTDGLLIGFGVPVLVRQAHISPSFLSRYNIGNHSCTTKHQGHNQLFDQMVAEYEVVNHAGGSAYNSLKVAQWILGTPNTTIMFGSVGDDIHSQIYGKIAILDGVKLIYKKFKEERTTTCAVMISSKGDKTQRRSCKMFSGGYMTIDHGDQSLHYVKNLHYVENAKVVYISGYFLENNFDVAKMVAERAKKSRKPILVSMKGMPLLSISNRCVFDIIGYADVLIADEVTARTFAFEHLSGHDMGKIGSYISKLYKRDSSPRIVVITCGGDDVIVAENDAISYLNVVKLHQDQIVDKNGAGDAFIGGYLAQMVKAKPKETCVRCGIWAAAKIMQQYGFHLEGVADFDD